MNHVHNNYNDYNRKINNNFGVNLFNYHALKSVDIESLPTSDQLVGIQKVSS